jgi:beta-glucanase (GH16 family)
MPGRPQLRWNTGSGLARPSTGAVTSIPSAVTSITQDAAATVSWQHNGLNTTSYTVTPYIGGSPQSTTTVSAPATSANVTGLTNSTAYTFTVKANNGAGSSAESAQSGANTPRLNQIFGDEFNGSFLDPAWAVLSRDGDQSNTETQYYLPANVSLDGSSNLVIVAQSQTVTLPGYDDTNPPTYAGANVTRNYTSGAVNWASFSYTYGIAQVSAKVAVGTNLWPAIWSMGSNCQATTPLNPDNVGSCHWHDAGSEEIDIAEFSGGTDYNAQLWYNGGITGTTHISVTNPDTTFHTYELNWAAGTISWKLDGTVVNGPFTTGVPSTPQFLILQTAIRGTPVFTSPNLVIDWVRVFHN